VFAAGAFPASITPSPAAASTTAVTLPVAPPIGRIASAESTGLELEYQASLVANFHARAPQRLGRLRAGHQLFNQSQEEDLRLVELLEMQQQARLLAVAAAIVGFRKIAQLASALEALLFQLHGKPASITPSAIRTVAQSVDLLDSLCGLATAPDSGISLSPAILVVDDEVISRETVCAAIERTGFATVSLDDPMKAEELLKQTRFDLIFLDIEMPGKSGLDLCASIRTMATNRATPVVFVTSHSDFGSWAQSSLRGGNDFIAKPFLSGELAVKALTWLFKATLHLLPATNLTDSKGQSDPAMITS
jgi:CheY-like chemotaxis protein